MCGIFVSISSHSTVEPAKTTTACLRCRGPDSVLKHDVKVEIPAYSASNATPSNYYLNFISTVLALRGSSIHAQPLIDRPTQSVLCWNGEAWRLGDELISGNDSRYVFDMLLQSTVSVKDSEKTIIETLTSIAGPFAFVFYDAPGQYLYYGRDHLGRRSLLSSTPAEETLILSSISPDTHNSAIQEVDSSAIYRLDLNRPNFDQKRLAWSRKLPSINRSVAFTDPRRLTIASPSIRAIEQKLRESLRLRVVDVPTLGRSQAETGHAKVAILFSGGLDCTLLARLTHDILPVNAPIDLLNVAFENPRSAAASKSLNVSPYESCPDRATGRSSFAEVIRVCPLRHWRFVAINIPYQEALAHRSAIVRLMYPHNTEMDISIAMALYFAARGQGQGNLDVTVDARHPTDSYTTTARVLLSGLGADELFAGYTRHASAFARGGYDGLLDELELDYGRLGQRNLGRDDRVMAHWGREVRYPYLDEDFVKSALDLKVWEKCGFLSETDDQKAGLADVSHKASAVVIDLDPAKQALRLLAWKLGMPGVAKEKKRAIQFGARTAKLEIGKGRRKGTDTLEA